MGWTTVLGTVGALYAGSTLEQTIERKKLFYNKSFGLVKQEVILKDMQNNSDSFVDKLQCRAVDLMIHNPKLAHVVFCLSEIAIRTLQSFGACLALTFFVTTSGFSPLLLTVGKVIYLSPIVTKFCNQLSSRAAILDVTATDLFKMAISLNLLALSYWHISSLFGLVFYLLNMGEDRKYMIEEDLKKLEKQYQIKKLEQEFNADSNNLTLAEIAGCRKKAFEIEKTEPKNESNGISKKINSFFIERSFASLKEILAEPKEEGKQREIADCNAKLIDFCHALKEGFILEKSLHDTIKENLDADTVREFYKEKCEAIDLLLLSTKKQWNEEKACRIKEVRTLSSTINTFLEKMHTGEIHSGNVNQDNQYSEFIPAYFNYLQEAVKFIDPFRRSPSSKKILENSTKLQFVIHSKMQNKNNKLRSATERDTLRKEPSTHFKSSYLNLFPNYCQADEEGLKVLNECLLDAGRVLQVNLSEEAVDKQLIAFLEKPEGG